MRLVSSRQNQAVQAFRALAGETDRTGSRVLLDGVHLVRSAHDAGLSFEVVAVAASSLAADTEERHLAQALDREGVDVIEASDQVFRAMSPVRTPSGLVAIAGREPSPLAEVCRGDSPFVLVIADVQDPGNVGSLLRAAEAGGATGAIVCAGAASPFSWKALRGSMGSALRLPVASGVGPGPALETLRRSGLHTVAAVARDGRDPDAVQWSGRLALLVGGEGPGLARDLVAACDEATTVPMAPPVESRKVAVAGAILIYAARRRRQ
jgi:TrmH family RNA methyltransferase